MTKYHMPWARLVKNLVKADDPSEKYHLGRIEEFNDLSGWEPAHRPLLEQIVFLKQFGFQPPARLYYGALYSIIATKIIGTGDEGIYGPDVEYRLIDTPEQAEPMLRYFESKYWDVLRKFSALPDDMKDDMNGAEFTDFIGEWLQFSL
jgi:hypothetical protein